jgi:hypothetical protein
MDSLLFTVRCSLFVFHFSLFISLACSIHTLFYPAADIERASQFEWQIDHSYLSADRLSLLVFHCSLFIFIPWHSVPAQQRFLDQRFNHGNDICGEQEFCCFPNYELLSHVLVSGYLGKRNANWNRSPQSGPNSVCSTL